jgi:hypothetical protein
MKTRQNSCKQYFYSALSKVGIGYSLSTTKSIECQTVPVVLQKRVHAYELCDDPAWKRRKVS